MTTGSSLGASGADLDAIGHAIDAHARSDRVRDRRSFDAAAAPAERDGRRCVPALAHRVMLLVADDPDLDALGPGTTELKMDGDYGSVARGILKLLSPPPAPVAG